MSAPRADGARARVARSDGVVHLVGWLRGTLGYNVHARGIATALSRLRPVVVTHYKAADGRLAADRAVIRRTWPDRVLATIALLAGDCMSVLDDAPGRRIAYTVWESTRLPESWMPALAAADRIWVPTEWGRGIMAESGLDPARIDVVPEGVDGATFHPAVAPAPDLARREGFKFVSVGKFEARKGSRLLIRAFDEAFADDPRPVWLVMAAHNPFDRDLDLGRELRALGLKRPDRLLFIPPVERHDVFAGLYAACDCFVLPTRAEGWGLPICEAMACGLPAIVTGYSGLLAFAHAHAYLVDHRLVPVDPPFFDTADGDPGCWAEPDAGHLRHLMRHVRDHPAEARARGLAGSAHVRRHFDWHHAGAAADAALRRLDEPAPERRGA